MAILTKEEIIAREQALYNSCVESKIDPVWNIAQDRLARWNSYLTEYPVSSQVTAWAEAMTLRYGPECRFYNNTVGWVIALLITRYGEAEYHWPTEGLTEKDLYRANELLNGKFPQGCQAIPVIEEPTPPQE